MINFRYHELEKLGEGGGGEVYLVEDRLKESRHLAMKVLHGGDLSERAAGEQFRNEVSVLASLQHPNLVRVSDFGMIRRSDNPALQGRRFFTMEYLRGSSARDWWRERRALPDGPVQLRNVVLQALGVLFYIHQRGIIHFDVKPENLILIPGTDDDPFPLLKLTDFGFSAGPDSAAGISLRGTLQYTAPELLRREPFDARVDLYSLGATLFDLIEDHCPFEAGDPVELIKKVLAGEPEYRMCRAKVYSGLLPLLTNLLQKDPGLRYTSAREAADALAGDGGVDASHVPERLSAPGFVGRIREREVIGSAIALLGGRAGTESGAAFTVEGPEGIGKTALLGEAARAARNADVPVFEAAVRELGLPFGAVLSILPSLRAEVMSRSPSGAGLVDRFADVIGGGSGNGVTDPGTLRARWLREKEKVTDALSRFFNQLSALVPFVVIVDEAQLLDPESEEVFRVVLRDAAPGSILLLAAMRDERSLTFPCTHMRLEELDAPAVSAMSASTIVPRELSELLGSRLYQLYGGLPSLIVEALRSVSTMLPPAGPDRDSDPSVVVEGVLDRLPRGLDELLAARYRSLDRERQLTLEILSCFSFPARLGIMQSVLPFRPERTTAYLSSLESGGFVTSHDGAERFVLRHARLKTLVLTAIGESRQESHRAIALAIEGSAEARSFPDLRELACQFRAAGDDPASLPWLEAAGEEGIRIAAYRVAAGLFREAVLIAGVTRPADRDRLNARLAHALFNCGDFREAADLAEKELRENPAGPARCAALHKTAGLSHSRLGNYEESRDHIMAALESSRDEGEIVELRQELAGIEIAIGNFAEAERLSLAQLERARGRLDPGILASIYNDLGIAAFFQNSYDMSAEYFGEALKIHVDTGRHAQIADAMMNIANVMSAKGDIVRAVDHLTRALATSREFGTLNQQAQIQNNLGIAHFKLKRFDEARVFYNEAREMFLRLESRQGGAFVLTNLGEVSFAEGRYEEALLTWQDALRFYREMDDGQGIAETLLQLAQSLIVMCAAGPAAALLDEAERLITERGLETFRFQLLYLRGMHQMCLGDIDLARGFFSQAERTPGDEGDSERRLLLGVRIAECDFLTGDIEPAAKLAREAKVSGEKMDLPQIVAEGSYLLGRMAGAFPDRSAEKPLPLFREGLDRIAKEPVTEITWRLALALGEEYRKRGQAERAKECFVKARLVLRYFLARFTSSELKNSYLIANDRQKVLDSLDEYLNT